MQPEDQSKQVLDLLHKHLKVQEGEPLHAHQPLSLRELRENLTTQIAWMLDYSFERLLQAMYRIDVNEKDFKAALTGASPVATTLADLVLERELKKVEIRQKYSQTYHSAKVQ